MPVETSQKTSPPASLRDRLKDETRQIIVEAFAACLAETEVDKVTFADVAARAGVGERTVYRHFPSRDDLLRELYVWLSRRTNPEDFLPLSEDDLTRRLHDFFRAFDQVAAAMKAAVITPQGYEMREAMRAPRNAAFRQALEGLTGEMAEGDKVKVAAAIQHMHSASAWLAMRDWGLDGASAADACVWAIQAMVADLKRRRGAPLESR